MNAELRLIIDCCRCNFVGSAHMSLTPPPAWPNWRHFQSLVRFHRVQGLVWQALEPHANALPDDVVEALGADARQQVAANLEIAWESDRLLKTFNDAGIPLLFLKGLTLGTLAYRHPLLKAGWDVDILVPEEALLDAAQLLESEGYALIDPANRSRLAAWPRTHKDSLWRRADPDIHVELHPRLTDNRRLLTEVGVVSSTQAVEVAAGVVLQTLATDELFAYLTVHGASSAWFRLKWISDLAGLLSTVDEREIEALYQRSQELGAGRAASQALLLADGLFRSLGNSRLRERLRKDRGAVLLASAALTQIISNTASIEPTERMLGTWRIHWTQLLLKSGLSFKIGEIYRQVRQAFG